MEEMIQPPKIEKNIPIPKRRYSERIDWLSFLPQLQIGDSFISDKIPSVKRAATELRINLVMRIVSKGTYRIWKT
jgi:hypothetical protein